MAKGNVRQRYSPFYKRKFLWLKLCIYCGEVATCLDHVFPICFVENLEVMRPAVRKELAQGLNIVPSCAECNRIAGNNPFVNIRDKRNFIQVKLKHRYAKYNHSVDWLDEELDALGFSLKTFVASHQAKRQKIHSRLFWPKHRRKC